MSKRRDDTTVAQDGPTCTPEASQWIAACSAPNVRVTLVLALFDRMSPPDDPDLQETVYNTVWTIVDNLAAEEAACWAVDLGVAPELRHYVRHLRGIPNHWEHTAIWLRGLWRRRSWLDLVTIVWICLTAKIGQAFVLSLLHP